MSALALQNFGFNDHLVRVSVVDGNTWFVGQDVCKALGISKYRDALATLDDDERGSVLVDTLGGRQMMTIISESGLYALIFKSRKAVAVQFRKWVTGEVLPSIRKAGGYGLDKALEELRRRQDEMEAAMKLLTESNSQLAARALAYHPRLFPLTRPDGSRRPQRYPKFWRHLDVRVRVVELCSQTTIDDALHRLRNEFGERAPTRSPLGRFWRDFAPVLKSPNVARLGQ
ncbi:Bro-N domain-containing protein [Nostoc sp. CHAB 5834]|nr:Bro-N domain-containing protein [Nostoc sp. CHAB 5834]